MISMRIACLAKQARPRAFIKVAAIAIFITGTATAQDTQQLLNSTIDVQARTDTSSQKSQQTVAQLAGERSEYFADYRVAIQQLEQLKVYNANLESIINDQERDKVSIRRQIDNFAEVEQGIVPLMYDLVAALRTVVELDLPFLRNERAERVQRLQDNLERSDLTVSEKYRQIMEAYQIETSYGRNIEAYSGTLSIGGQDRKVDLLRIGRILLAYQTPDRSETGFWDKTTRQWTELDDSYRRPVTEGLKIARKQAAPTLLSLPLPAAENAP
jgi:Protein of unknown function (DUF3450)